MAFERGYLQVYTGNGKGKTTAAIGLGVRAAGAGLRVIMVQFMKGRRYSELDALRNIPNFEVHQHGRDEFVSKDHPEQIDIDLAREGLSHAERAIMSSKYDLVILDELNVALDFGLVPISEVVNILRTRPRHVEVVITGRYAPKEILELADLVTEMKEMLHFYNNGVKARKGIEY
jgi:cob(I)alamin adenosyltransferase